MRLAKRVTAVVLSAAMLVSGLYVSDTAQAKRKTHAKYETGQVEIITDLVPDDFEITKNGTVPTIHTGKNVKFTLDCNVDCNWSVKTEAGQEVDKGHFDINKFGEVEIDKSAPTGVYTITATGKNLYNSQVTALCYVDVSSTPERGTVILDKERMEAYNELYDKELSDSKTPIVQVDDDGLGLTINGQVNNLPLIAKVTPEYIKDDTVEFKMPQDITEAEINGAGTRLTTHEKTKGTVDLDTTCGELSSSTIRLTVNNRDYTARVNCDEISPTAANSYNLRLNEDVTFNLTDNEIYTLPSKEVDHIQWTMKYGAGDSVDISTAALNANGNGTVETELGDFIFTGGGKYVNLLTPLKSETNKYKAYQDQLKISNTIAMTASVYYTDESLTAYPLSQITLSFADEDNTFSGLTLDFSETDLIENIDYRIIEETIGNETKPVYYFESGEAGADNILNFIEATQLGESNALKLGVRDFEASRDDVFDKDATYEIAYSLHELEEKKQNTNQDILKSADLDSQGRLLKRTNEDGTKYCILNKEGVGYFKLRMTMTSTKLNAPMQAEFIIRFVSSAAGISVEHKNYEADHEEYPERYGEAVVHIRKGEADTLTVYQNGVLKQIKEDDPFLEFAVTYTYKGQDGKVATASRQAEADGTYKINGNSEGKVEVTISSKVDASEAVSYILYVNNELYDFKGQLEIDLSSAIAANQMAQGENNVGVVNGCQTNIPLKLRVAGDTDAGIPLVEWSIVEANSANFATIKPSPDEVDTGLLTTLKSTGNENITVRATAVSNPEVYAEQKITILEVPAVSITEIGEQVAVGETGVLTNTSANAGTAKVGQQFILEPKAYEPANSTGVSGKIEWSSSDETKATVNKDTGLVTTLAEGSVNITAAYSSSTTGPTTKIFSLTISGYDQQVERIVCSPASLELTRVGDTATLTVTVLPENVVNKNVEFKVTEGEDIVSVDDKGSVMAKAVGNAVITITSKMTPSVSTKVNVVVRGQNDNTPSGTTPPPALPTPSSPTTSQTPTTPAAPAKNSTATVSGSTYVVTNASTSKGEVAMKKAKSGKSVKVPATVKISGYTYKVTTIKANAFKGNKKLKSVTIGANVKSIEKNAFYGCTKLTSVTIQSKVLSKVGAKAFAKGSKKVTVTVPKKKANAYKKLLKKAGISKKAKYKKKK